MVSCPGQTVPTMMNAYDKEHNIKSDTFGRDCCAAKFICAVNKMQVKGDPAGFKQFLMQEGIRHAIFAQIYGKSILHSISFSRCAVPFKKEYLLYLDTVCRNATSLRSALQKDIKNNTITSIRSYR